jgi:hypothetical protein
MANKTVTVKSSGGDYTSLNAALAGESTNLVSTLDGILTIECYAMGDTTAVDTGTGYTTDADHYISILTPAAERHPGKWDSNKYYLSLGPGYGVGIITIREAYVRIVGLQIENTKAQNDSPIGIRLNVGTTTSDIRIQSNLIVATGATTNHESAIGILISGDVTARIGNNVVWNFATSVLYSSYVAQNIYLYANTIIGTNSSNYGENLQGSGTYKYRDNIIQNCATCFGINMDGKLDDSSYNISSDDTSPQSGLRSLTVSFVDSTNATIRSRDYHLAAADTAAKDAGESLASDTDFALSVDIDGDTRTNDIGADEYVAAATGIPRSNPFSRPFSQSLGRGGF